MPKLLYLVFFAAITWEVSSSSEEHLLSKATICGGDIIKEKGNFHSPNYPEDYGPNKECTWRITVPEDHQVALMFQSFKIENHEYCMFDYLEIRDGHESKSPLLGRFCGYKIPDNIQSTGNKMSVKFVSDKSEQKEGFAADFIKELDECEGDHGCEHECTNTIGAYKCECRIGFNLHSDGKRCEEPCGGVIEETSGTITSPSFPDSYPPNKSCIWEIIAPPQYTIILNFTHFNLQENDDCKYDSVDVRSKMADGEFRKHGVFCGSRLPPLITSESNLLLIDFSSDESVHGHNGFMALFFTDKDECTSKNGGCKHICQNTIGSYTCFCLNGFVLQENKHDCKEHICGGDIIEEMGILRSPKYAEDDWTNKYPCTWRITVPEDHQVALKFQSFKIEYRDKCEYDYLEIMDGHESTSPLLGRFCGYGIPDDICSTGNKMTVKLVSDRLVQKTEFAAFFIKELDECFGDYGCEYQCTNTMGAYKCECGVGFKLHSDGERCEELDECMGDHGCEYQCTNTIGSYKCKCRSGFELQSDGKKCEDKDECSPNNGGCHHICRNTLGSYTCSCRDGFVLSENNHYCKERGCSYLMTAPFGEITSPNFPYYYPSSKICSWLFATTPGHRIKLTFHELAPEPGNPCTFDYVAAYDGQDQNAPSLDKLCGNEVPSPILSSGNRMYLLFKSHDNTQLEGFRATHTTVCGGRLQAHRELKHLYSHVKYGEQNYEEGEDCDWIIQAPNDWRVQLRFLTFELENEPCVYDYVEVYDGEDDSTTNIGRFCGNKVPLGSQVSLVFYSSGNTLMVRFHSDGASNASGFSAAYTAFDPLIDKVDD